MLAAQKARRVARPRKMRMCIRGKRALRSVANMMDRNHLEAKLVEH
jgi:hypothetical protein